MLVAAALVAFGIAAGPRDDLRDALGDVATLAQDLGAPEVPGADRALDAILAQASTSLAGLHGEAAIIRLNRFFFDELGLEREVEREDVELMLVPNVVANRRGSCLGLATLYLSIAEHVGLPVRGVLVPGHFFVRLEGGGSVRNIELLRRGEAMPDDWYLERYRVPEGGRRAYLRGLSSTETAAVLAYNVGNAWRARGAAGQARARAAYLRAVELFPDFAEAQASLGLSYQEEQRYDLAERAYLRALAANPCLPGLDRNLASVYLAIGDAKNAELYQKRDEGSAARCGR